jgi:IS30 family transposase
LEREFWRQVRQGLSTADAAAAAGVSEKSGGRWFRKGGGMPTLDLAEPSGRYLSFAEREDIAMWSASGVSMREMARRLGRASSTISRELRRNSPARGRSHYRASKAQVRADDRARRPKIGKLMAHPPLREYLTAQLSGPCRWSPEQISARLVVDFPDDERMRISHESIYQALYVQGRGELRRELTRCLRTGRAMRKPARRRDARISRRIPDMMMISERPAEAEDRAVPGHWEGDLIVGSGASSQIGTLVERATRFTMLCHLPDGRSAAEVNAAIVTTMSTLPEQLRRTLTWDQGRELTNHAQLAMETDLDVFFCDPHSPWQRGTNENTNGLLRQYFPKGSDLSEHSADDLAAVAAGLNGRPRKALGWKTPSEAMAALLSVQAEDGVATTD